jgi:phosphocarrier protein
MNGCGDGDPSAARRRRSVTIVNERGLHARAAARFAKLAEVFDARIVVSSKGYSVSALSIMGLMMLAAGPGTEVEIAAAGSEAEAALAALAALVEDGFEEN